MSEFGSSSVALHDVFLHSANVALGYQDDAENAMIWLKTCQDTLDEIVDRGWLNACSQAGQDWLNSAREHIDE